MGAAGLWNRWSTQPAKSGTRDALEGGQVSRRNYLFATCLTGTAGLLQWGGALPSPLRSAVLENFLLNPDFREAGKKCGKLPCPASWTRRGLVGFSNTHYDPLEDCWEFTAVGSDQGEYPLDLFDNRKLHYDYAEAGYFQTYGPATPGEVWTLSIEGKVVSIDAADTDGAACRVMLYYRDDRNRILGWVATIFATQVGTWELGVANVTLPAGTTNIVAVVRGRLLRYLVNAGDTPQATFRLRHAVLAKVLPATRESAGSGWRRVS